MLSNKKKRGIAVSFPVCEQMNILPFLHFFAFLAYLYLLVFVLWKNPKALINRACAAFLACLAVWSFGFIFIHNLYASKDTARFFMNIASVGWSSFSTVFLWFSLIFVKKKKVLKRKIFYVSLFILPLLFIYKQWTDFLIVDYSRQSYGWASIWSESIWPYIFYAYYLSFMGAGLYLVFNFRKKTEKPNEKKQAVIIFTTTLISLIIGSLTDVLLPRLDIHTIPNMASILVLIWGGGLVCAIERYKFMALTPAMAANDIISTMTDSLILLSPSATIMTVNQYTLDLLGYKKSELIGQPVDTIFTGKIPFKGRRIGKFMEEDPVRDYEMTYKTKSGKRIPVSFSGSVMRNKEGELVGIVGIARDIAERKKAEEKERELTRAAEAAARIERERVLELIGAYIKLEETQDMLVQAGKMAAVGQLASGVAHEVKNPLAIIIQGVNYLEKKLSPEQKDVFKILGIMKESVGRADNIIKSILDFSKITKLALRPEDINSILEDSLTLVKQGGSFEGIEVIKETKQDISKVLIDKNKMEQVFVNLFLNAVQAMPRGGKLIIRSYETQLEDARRGIGRRGEDYFGTGERVVMVEIEDTGIGISKEISGRIFDPFFTTKGPGGGTGLGLSITHNIIDMHRSLIDVQSQVGKGTKVIITLRIAKYKMEVQNEEEKDLDCR